MAVLGLHSCGERGVSLVWASVDCSLVAVCKLLIAVASHCGAWTAGVWASVGAAHGLSTYAVGV